MLLQVQSLTKTYPAAPGTDAARHVLSGVSLTLDAGETLALTGESGSGKSTLMTLIAGLDRPDSGQIRIEGADIAGWPDRRLAQMRRRQIGLIFQQFNLIPSLDVAANLAFQARLAGRFDQGWTAIVAQRLGLDGHLSLYPEQLSGGQQQRVAIGRALAARPALVLADEPTGNLDEATADRVIDLMLELVIDSGAGLLMVTHSSRLAARLGRRTHLSHGRLA
ncbi:ABC transporter ATP-binding protein [Pseudoruegeria sp. SK021]|uniref:ABC transporter ATP-binding protein n=1 Tax=Pseudoruegeria sp. SK021 TaxID=1933035 RepID=UPI000A250C04|nr:ABC transporter ATP-binding protein [Pseudoruegeria sp. SK021]OSP54522.1 ABC transporter ATP-binding protein [Pseudoruegeria sp. SK021]